MTAQTATLTDFLLARIDADRAEAQNELALRGSGTHVPPSSPFDPARVLAECEAKRKIVEAEAWADNHFPCDVSFCEDCNLARLKLDVLRALALPYTSHPDFREEWQA